MGSTQIAPARTPVLGTSVPTQATDTAGRRKAFLKEARAMQSTLTAKGQMTLPKKARERLGLKAGDTVKFFFDPDGRLSILPTIPITALKGILKSHRATPVTLEEMEEGIAKGATERYRRFLGQ